MRLLSVLILTMTIVNANAESKKSIPPMSVSDMKLYYTEIVPGESIEFQIGHKKYCPQDRFSIKQYESEENLPSTETNKTVPVKVLNIHVRLISPCSNNPKVVTEPLKIQGDKTRMTQVYLFSESDMNVNL